MRVVELRDAETGKLYRVHPDDVSLIADQGENGSSCLVTLAGKQLIVEGTTAAILRKISAAIKKAEA